MSRVRLACSKCSEKLVIDNNFNQDEQKRKNEFVARSIYAARMVPKSSVIEFKCKNCKEWNAFNLVEQGVIA